MRNRAIFQTSALVFKPSCFKTKQRLCFERSKRTSIRLKRCNSRPTECCVFSAQEFAGSYLQLSLLAPTQRITYHWMHRSITCIFPRTPVLSILLATFTVFPQISYCGFWAPMTPAITGPWLIPENGQQQSISKCL